MRALFFVYHSFFLGLVYIVYALGAFNTIALTYKIKWVRLYVKEGLMPIDWLGSC